MSATAFQRRRRELERIRLEEQEKECTQVEEMKVPNDVDYSKMKKDELKGLLTFKGIEFDDRATKDELVTLLEGVE